MIDALVSGHMHGNAEQRTGKSGGQFTTAKVVAHDQNKDVVYVDVIAFSNTVREALMALEDGAGVSLAGSLTVKAWLDKEGIPHPSASLVARTVIALSPMKR